MELERFKSAWQNHPLDSESFSAERVSRSVQLVRVSAVRDLQRSDELSRLIFCFLFALVLIGASVEVMMPGPGRAVALLFALVLLIDGAVGVATLTRRFQEQATASLREFITREHRRAEIRLRFERYSQGLMFLLALLAVLLLAFGPRPASYRDSALDALSIMAVVTAFLAVAWRRAKSRAGEIRRDLERQLKDLEA